MNKRICCVFNVAPHYNEPIYSLMDKELECEFFIGDKIHAPIKLMDYTTLNGFKLLLKYKVVLFSFYWQKGAMSVFRQGKYTDIILTGEPFCLSTWVILFVAKLKGIRTYVWTHGWYGKENIFKVLLKKIFFGTSTMIFLYGDYARELMLNKGFKADKLVTIYNSLDYNKQIVIRNNLRKSNIYSSYFKNDNPVVIFIGRVQKIKKVELVLEALSLLRDKRGLTYNFVVVGEEFEPCLLRDNIEKQKLDNQVWLYGPCFDEGLLGTLLYNAHVCVSPGNVGLTSIHSLMYGTPVITHDNFSKQMPEFETIQDNVTGSFFIENNVEDLSNKIVRWAILSENDRKVLRNRCFEIVDKKYNPNVQIEILKKIFQE